MGAFALEFADFRLQSPDQGLGDLVLKIEQVNKLAIVTFRPNVVAGARVNKLRADPHPVAALAHAALQHKAHPKILPHLPHVG